LKSFKARNLFGSKASSKAFSLLLILLLSLSSLAVLVPKTSQVAKATGVSTPYYGCDDILVGWQQYSTYALWSTAMDSFLTTMKAAGGNVVSVLVYSDVNTNSFYSYTSGSYFNFGYMSPSFIFYAGANGKNGQSTTFATVLADFSAKLHAKGMLLDLQPCPPPSATMGVPFQTMMSTTANQNNYIANISQMITDTNCDIVNAYSEPFGPLTYGYASTGLMNSYISFLNTAVPIWKAVKSGLTVMVMGLPNWDNGPFITAGGMSGLPSGTILCYHMYYWYTYPPASYSYEPFAADYYNGNFAQGKADWISWMDTYGQVSYCLANNIPFWFEALGCNQVCPNAIQFLADVTAYCNARSIGWCASGSPSAQFTFNSPTVLNSYGITMFSNISSSTPSSTTDTIGSTSSQLTMGLGTMRVCAITASASGILSTIGINVQTTSSGHIALAIYTAYTGGGTGTLSGKIGYTANTSIVAGWNDLAVIGSPNIVAAHTYYIGYESDDGTTAKFYLAYSGAEYIFIETYNTFPDPTTAYNTDGATWNMRMTYTQYYNITVYSSYGEPTENETLSAGSNSTVGVTSPWTGTTGTQYICTGYSIDGGGSTAGTSYLFSNIQANHTITFNWQTQYYLTVTSPYGSPTGGGWYASGSSTTFYVLPNNNIYGGVGILYVNAYWAGQGSGSYSGYSTSNTITMNNPINETASWTTQYLLTAHTDANSIITPTTEWVDSGSTVTFNYTANVGHSIQYVLVDGSNVTVTGNYTFTNVQAPHSITISTFTALFTITASDDAHSIISPSGAIGITAFGSDQTFVFTASSGYYVNQVFVDGSPVTLASSYTFINIAADHTIAITSSIISAMPSPTTPATLPTTLNVAPFWQYLFSGNFLGFFQAIYLNAFGLQDILYGSICMLFLVPLYIESKSLLLLSIIWILLGSSFLALMPAVSGLAVIFLILGISSLLWRLVHPN